MKSVNQTQDILAHLNPSQQEAVSFGEGPLIVLAGPGSGKTRVLTHRAAFLIKEKGVEPNHLLLLTFTNKAADEMKKRIKKLLGQQTRLPFAGTFHSFCARVLRIDGQENNIPQNFLIYDIHDQLDTIKMAMKEININDKSIKPKAVLNTISQAKNELISALEYPQYARGPFQTTVARIYLTYQRLLKKHHALDFDDLLNETIRLFEKQKPILTKYQNRFQYVLIDEYQDTNQAQYILTQRLAGKWRNLCVVGDASQAIYGFRGANHRNLVNLQTDFPDLSTVNLERNYRSTQTILNAANQVIRQNTNHPVLNLWTKKTKGEPVKLYEAQSETDEARFVIDTINRILLEKKWPSLDSFAVLYRTNAQSRVLEEAFLHLSIPYNLVGGIRFYERKEIKDCLAYLKFLSNPQDAVSQQRLEKIGKRRWQKFIKLTEKKSKKDLSTLELLDQILEETNYLDLYNPKDPQDLNRLENIKELRSVATQFSDLNQFLENVALIQQEYLPDHPKDLDQAKPASVTLMTTHAAKGTEFPVVFIVGLEEGLFPHSRSLMDKEGTEEERRLFYVGMTRAKEKLYLSYARKRLYFGQRSTNPISRFIANIPTDLIELLNHDKIST